MACGTPVVTTACTSMPEVCGDDALYVDPHDPADLAAALVRLAGDDALRCELGQRGRTRAAGFTWEKSAARMDAIFGEYA